METKTVVEYLKTIPLFENLTDAPGELELYRMAPIVQEGWYEVGGWLFRQGETSDCLYLVLEGQVRLTMVDRDGVMRHLKDVGPGEMVGETGLLVGDVHDATAEVIAPLHVLYLEREPFLEFLEERPRVQRRLNMRRDVAMRREIPHFDWMREGEWVVFSVNRHWAYLLRKILPPIALFVLFAPLFYLLVNAATVAFLWFFALVLGIFLIFLVSLVAYQYVDWDNDFFVLTTQRIVHIENVWPFKQNFEESMLENIQDTYEVRPTFAANVLNFGDLVLQTAGETVQIDLVGIPDPSDFRELIFREIRRRRALAVLRSRGEIREMLKSRLNLEPPPPLVESPVTESQEVGFVMLLLRALKDYFFPPSWSESEDGSTIIWRRFWLPGFFRYLRVFLPLAALTVGGAWGLLEIWHQESLHWLLGVWLLLEAALFGALLWLIEDWRNDYFEITPNRIVLVFQQPLLLSESRRDATLDRIQNISFEVPGILANLFDYGHVMLETAGTTGKFELRWVRHPQEIQAEISRRQQEHSQRQQNAEAQRRRDEMLSWFATYDALQGSA